METHIVRKQQPVSAGFDFLALLLLQPNSLLATEKNKRFKLSQPEILPTRTIAGGKLWNIFHRGNVESFFSCFAAKTNWSHIEQLRRGEKYRLHADIWRSLVLHRLKIWNHFSRRYWWSIKKVSKSSSHFCGTPKGSIVLHKWEQLPH